MKTPPKIGLFETALIYGCVILLMLWFVVSSSYSLIPILLLLLFSAIPLLLSYRLSIVITAEGVTQKKWGGYKRASWADIREAEWDHQGILLFSDEGSFAVPLMFFRDADYAIEYIAAHLPETVRRELEANDT